LNPEYDKYGIQPLDDGAVILRIDSEKHLFERVGAIRCEQTEVVLQRFLKGETLEDEGSFRTVESVSAGRERFESQLQDEIVELIYEGKVDEEQAKSLAESVAESISEQYS
jgi:hypothetical protein